MNGTACGQTIPPRPGRKQHLTTSLLTHQDPVKGRRSPASLHVSQDGHPRVVPQLLDHELQETQLVNPGGPASWALASLGLSYSCFTPTWKKILVSKFHFLKGCFIDQWAEVCFCERTLLLPHKTCLSCLVNEPK